MDAARLYPSEDPFLVAGLQSNGNYNYIGTDHKFSTVICIVLEMLAIRTIRDIKSIDELRILGFLSSLGYNSSKNKRLTKINLNVEQIAKFRSLKKFHFKKILILDGHLDS